MAGKGVQVVGLGVEVRERAPHRLLPVPDMIVVAGHAGHGLAAEHADDSIHQGVLARTAVARHRQHEGLAAGQVEWRGEDAAPDHLQGQGRAEGQGQGHQDRGRPRRFARQVARQRSRQVLACDQNRSARDGQVQQHEGQGERPVEHVPQGTRAGRMQRQERHRPHHPSRRRRRQQQQRHEGHAGEGPQQIEVEPAHPPGAVEQRQIGQGQQVEAELRTDRHRQAEGLARLGRQQHHLPESGGEAERQQQGRADQGRGAEGCRPGLAKAPAAKEVEPDEGRRQGHAQLGGHGCSEQGARDQEPVAADGPEAGDQQGHGEDVELAVPVAHVERNRGKPVGQHRAARIGRTGQGGDGLQQHQLPEQHRQAQPDMGADLAPDQASDPYRRAEGDQVRRSIGEGLVVAARRQERRPRVQQMVRRLKQERREPEGVGMGRGDGDQQQAQHQAGGEQPRNGLRSDDHDQRSARLVQTASIGAPRLSAR